ncbi:hypothetical protein ACG7TL_004317 [Trametes sanguinea]
MTGLVSAQTRARCTVRNVGQAVTKLSVLPYRPKPKLQHGSNNIGWGRGQCMGNAGPGRWARARHRAYEPETVIPPVSDTQLRPQPLTDVRSARYDAIAGVHWTLAGDVKNGTL